MYVLDTDHLGIIQRRTQPEISPALSVYLTTLPPLIDSRHFVPGRIRVSTMDLRIASIALSLDMTLLTRNLTDFRLVPGLRVEDWTA